MIYLWDYETTKNGGGVWHAALTKAFPMYQLPLPTGNAPRQSPPDQHDAFKNPNAILFVHSGVSGQWIKKAENPDVRCKIVFVSTNGCRPGETNGRGTIHYCHWLPIHFSQHATPRGIPEVAQFVAQAASNDCIQIDWSLLQPKYAPAALRVLCEAWLISRRPPLQSDNGVSIRAPATAADWFRPFEDDANPAGADRVAKSMGSASSEAKILLTAVVTDPDSDLSQPIANFIAKVLSSSGLSNGPAF